MKQYNRNEERNLRTRINRHKKIERRVSLISLQINSMGKNVDIKVVGVHLTITDALRKAAENCAKSLIKHCDDNSIITVNLRVDGPRKVAEVVATCDGRRMRVEKENKYRYNDLYDTMASAFDSLAIKMDRYRDKRNAYRNKDSIRFIEEEDAAVEAGPQIVKVKNFALKPMTPDEACLQMEMLGHNFFMFRNSQNDTTSVVYRRNDGNYGLINT